MLGKIERKERRIERGEREGKRWRWRGIDWSPGTGIFSGAWDGGPGEELDSSIAFLLLPSFLLSYTHHACIGSSSGVGKD